MATPLAFCADLAYNNEATFDINADIQAQLIQLKKYVAKLDVDIQIKVNINMNLTALQKANQIMHKAINLNQYHIAEHLANFDFLN